MRHRWNISTSLVALALAALTSTASATDDKFHITDREKAACTQDAVRLCIDTYPDESRLLQCMKQNRSSLSPTCLAAFDAGVRRRKL